MNTSIKQFSYILPHGEQIREFLNQPGVTNALLKKVLRGKGVFIQDYDKVNSIPILVNMIMGPDDFEELCSNLKTKEDNIKRQSSSINLASVNFSLIDAVQNINIRDVASDEYANFSIMGDPSFVTDGSKVKVDICLKREDYRKNWSSSTQEFQGSLTIDKRDISEDLSFTNHFTSPETKEALQKIARYVIKQLKENGIVNKDEKEQKILFSDFSNDERILFFQYLTFGIKSDDITFIDIRDTEFRPDFEDKIPSNLEWMADKQKISFNGKNIHETFFLKDIQYHKYIKVWRFEATFKFEHLNVKGDCVVDFEFPLNVNQHENNTEFEMKVVSIQSNDIETAAQKENLKLLLLKKFDVAKIGAYRKVIGPPARAESIA